MTDDDEPQREPAKKSRRRRARGSIYKRADGRWCAALSLKGGSRKYIYGDTLLEVEQRLTAAKSTIDKGGPLVDDRLTVSMVVDAFLEEREHRVRPRTIESYRQLVEQHIKPQLGKYRAATLTSEDVQAFANRRVREGASASMMHHVLVVLRMAFKLAVARRRVTFNPTEGVHGPKVERAVGSPLDATDTQKLLTAVRTHPLAAVWFLAASLGLRQGEIFGLRWRDVNLDEGRVAVKHQLQIKRAKKGQVGAFASRAELVPPKTKRALRTLALDPAVVVLLRARKKRQAADRLAAGEAWEDKLGLIFTTPYGQPLDRGSMSKLHRDAQKLAGVRHVRFHDLRHGAATLMLAAGVDPATLSATLGHSRVAFTLDTYVHASDTRVDDAVGRLASALALGSASKSGR
jgi:integrase